MLNNAHDAVLQESADRRAYLESLIRDDFERSHPGATLEGIKRRMSFSKEDKGLYQQWLAAAAARAAAISGSTKVAAE